MVAELKDRVAFLKRALDRRSVEAKRYQQIVAGLMQTNNQLATQMHQLEAPQEPLGGPQSAEERPDRVDARPATGGAQEGAEHPWWRRMFGE
ncbi:MAG: hypothetical protein LC781_18930 [Actinobacteria bacterium]|nr:hypothetical protein [Actinomycetota bacterium]